MSRPGFRTSVLFGVLTAWSMAAGSLPWAVASGADDGGTVRITPVARPLPEVVASLDKEVVPSGDTIVAPDTAAAAPSDESAAIVEPDDSGFALTDNFFSGQAIFDSQTSCCPEAYERFWFRSDYLLWWTKGTELPPLVTASPEGTPREEAGVLGQPGTTILFGDGYVNNDSRSGYRLTGGFWLDNCMRCGIAFDYFELGARDTNFVAGGDGDPIIARPFYNVETGLEDSQLVSFPGVISGSVSVNSRDFFQSTGAWLNLNLCGADWCCCDPCSDPCDPCATSCCLPLRRGYRITLLAGYRYYRYIDSLSIHEGLTVTELDPPGLTGTRINVLDDFRTENEFNGGEIGFRSEVYRGRWSLGLLTKMAIGNNRQVVTIQGQTTTAIPSLLPVTYPGGLLTAHTNIGRYTDDQFTIIPQLGLEVGFRVCDHLRFYTGYDLIYWPHVQTAGSQIDMNVDPRNIPPAQPGGTKFPEPQLCSTDFWAQGLNFGFELRY
jgi:hypothetical protein